MVELGIGFVVGFASALAASWWGFRRGIQVQRPELFVPQKKPEGEVEVAYFDITAR